MPQRIILGSGSPRRKHLLSQMGLTFEVVTTHADETYPYDMPVAEVPAFLARKKLNWFAQNNITADLIITADTVVVLEDKILNKPNDANEARNMLLYMGGCAHTVITGVAMHYQGQQTVFCDHTQVQFAALTPDIIDYYLAHHQVLDKAGAYGVQDWIGLVGVQQLQGSYTNVMGLPTQKLFDYLPKEITKSLLDG